MKKPISACTSKYLKTKIKTLEADIVTMKDIFRTEEMMMEDHGYTKQLIKEIKAEQKAALKAVKKTILDIKLELEMRKMLGDST